MNTPRRLETTRCKGQEYFIDDRLQEYRPIDKPFISIPFNSEKGIEISEADMLMRLNDHTTKYEVRCTKCGKLLFEGTMMEIRGMIIYCTECTVKRKDPSGD